MTTELEGKKTANVCIVGAGYNGLTTRIELARKGVGVELLEAREAGFGCSGRNAGHCAPTFTYFDLPELCLLLGELWAERLIHRQTWANDRVSAPVERYQIQCEWQQRGYTQAAHRLSAISALQKKVSDYNAVGAKPWFLDRHEVEELTGSPHFHGGQFHTDGSHLNPLGYARGLSRAFMQQGGLLHTSSPAISVTRESGKWFVRTSRGEVLTEKVIFTTGACTARGQPRLDRTLKIMKVFVAAAQPLSPETRRIVMSNNTTMNDGRGDFYLYKSLVSGNRHRS